MNIRLLTNVSFVMGEYEAGAILECEGEEADALVTAGLAEVVTDSSPESAMLGGAKERATLPRAKART